MEKGRSMADLKYLNRLAKDYPNIMAASAEIINLSAILNLPKGTEFFASDIHGEYEAFSHTLRNGSGSIRLKIDDVFGDSLSENEKRSLATLIYYPREKMELVLSQVDDAEAWYAVTLQRLVAVCKRAAQKYTRSRVRKALPKDFAYIIEELMTENRHGVDKQAYYAAIVTGAYRHVLDDVAAGREVDPVWRDEVEHVSHRHYSTGFYYGQPGQYYDNSRYIRDWQVCAVVTDCDADGNATLSLRNKFAAGDEIELVGPDSRPFTMTAPVMHDLEGFELYEPRTPQTVFKMKLPRYVPPMSFVRHAVSLSAKD